MPDSVLSTQTYGVSQSEDHAAAWLTIPETGAPDAETKAAAWCAPMVNRAVVSRIDRALRATGYLSLRGLDVCAVEGFVVLRGRVPTYYLKQMAQAVALNIWGVTELQNELEVVAPLRQPADRT